MLHTHTHTHTVALHNHRTPREPRSTVQARWPVNTHIKCVSHSYRILPFSYTLLFLRHNMSVCIKGLAGFSEEKGPWNRHRIDLGRFGRSWCEVQTKKINPWGLTYEILMANMSNVALCRFAWDRQMSRFPWRCIMDDILVWYYQISQKKWCVCARVWGGVTQRDHNVE